MFLFLSSISPVELLIIFIIILIVVLIFGQKKIPELLKSLAEAVKEFKKATKETAE